MKLTDRLTGKEGFWTQDLPNEFYSENIRENSFNYCSMGLLDINDPNLFLERLVEYTNMPAFFIGNFPKKSLSALEEALGKENFDKAKLSMFKSTITDEKGFPNEGGIDNLLYYWIGNYKGTNKDPFKLIEKNKEKLISLCSKRFICESIEKIPLNSENHYYGDDLSKKDLKSLFSRFPIENAPYHFYRNGDVSHDVSVQVIRDFWENIDYQRLNMMLVEGFNLKDASPDFNSLNKKYLDNEDFAYHITKKISSNKTASYEVLAFGKQELLLSLGKENIERLDRGTDYHLKYIRRELLVPLKIYRA